MATDTNTSTNCLDHVLCEQMASHIETLTLSGEQNLNSDVMKKLKKICRISDLYVKHAYHLLMSTLTDDHSEVRLSTLKIIDELFNRSHCFRDLLVSEFQAFLELTVETNHDQPLPPPASIAKKLKSETLKVIQQWYEKFGEAYKKLVLGYNFLKSCKMVDFGDIRARTIAERQREEEIERKKQLVLMQKLEKVLKEMEENVPDMKTTATEIENCCNLLIPKPEDFFINETDFATDISDNMNSENHETNSEVKNDETSQDCDLDEEPCERTEFVSDFGLGNRKYNLSIEIKPKSINIEETEDNKDIFKTLKDAVHMVMKKYLPKFPKWMEILTKAGSNDQKVKEMIDLKNKLESLLSKTKEMKLIETGDLSDDSDEDGDDFEEVPDKEGYEAEVPLHLLTATEMGLKEDPKKGRRGRKRSNQNWKLKSDVTTIEDPTSREANLLKLGLLNKQSSDEAGCSKSFDPSILNNVPVVPFGPDIACWENPDKIEKPMVQKNDSLHRFWTPSEHESETVSKYDLELLTSRTFHYPCKFVPVTWTCRAPLPNGTLCPRMDRQKCPFHGKIIGRDKTGKPTNIEEARRLNNENIKKEQERLPEWKDPEFQRDIEISLGVDLGSSSNKGKGKGKGKGKNKKYANLTDIKEIKNTSRSRLEKKIFNRSSMKKVTSVMNAADYKRVRDKFGNQFNYAYTK